MAVKPNDARFMQQALELARRGIALTSPNPRVGAVVVSAEGKVAGRGSHTYDGVKHAEILAIESAGERARGGTLYLNLEPCSHVGRTGPCSDAIIAAGVKRVVAAMRDPNPLVAGSGFDKLRAAGIEVVEGLCEPEARKLNEAFAKYIRHKTPFITLKTAMTLDGKIAPPPGDTITPSTMGSMAATGGWITSEVARAHVHEMRHANDAIMVGVGTIIADDPLLTDRTGLPRRRPLMRVILDSRLRLPLDSRVVRTADYDVMVFCCFAEERKRRELEEHGIIVEQVPMRQPMEDGTIPFPSGAPTSDGRPDLERVLAKLGEREITSVIIEGGAMVNWAALSAGIVDKIFFYYAPKILAGTGSIPLALGTGYRRFSEAAYVRSMTLHRFGEDFAVEGYLHDPYADEIHVVPDPS
ncbi:MAG TPA: bifunctional diaminohydroxyphosphoribosylaminopyrimidine deaminase/5-amino-6-(5-phosphoribosylamino)uracil reductase RibD [Candidatus Eisenbacteria bacterium]|nr:bifunctional diaminohydroxyphosphoribosylaminopyrimidine deaminase/5-amino-6-(5-phosphoribosylamino)uracil reductase RibD [Candidatus Eisenbacteria bacterium]